MEETTFTIMLRDKTGKKYPYNVMAEDYVQAVRKAMNKAFQDMPDNKFGLAGISGDEDKLQGLIGSSLPPDSFIKPGTTFPDGSFIPYPGAKGGFFD